MAGRPEREREGDGREGPQGALGLLAAAIAAGLCGHEQGGGAKSALGQANPREWLGLGLVALSYLIGWPVVALLALAAYRLEEPLLLGIGGPLAYGLSHLVFLAGSWLAAGVW
jgi:hypothetical protein